MAKKKTVEEAALDAVAGVDVDALIAENVALKLALARHEPSPPPIIEYPKWLYKRDADGQPYDKCIVPDAAAHAARMDGDDGWSEV